MAAIRPDRQVDAAKGILSAARTEAWRPQATRRGPLAREYTQKEAQMVQFRRPMTSMLPITAIMTVALALHAPCVSAQTIDDLRKRIDQLEQSTREQERSTREQVDLLKRQIEQQETARGQERRAAEERERTVQTPQEQEAQHQLRLSTQEERAAKGRPDWAQLVELHAGAKQNHHWPPPVTGQDIPP